MIVCFSRGARAVRAGAGAVLGLAVLAALLAVPLPAVAASSVTVTIALPAPVVALGRPAEVTGRVTHGGRAAPGVEVVLEGRAVTGGDWRELAEVSTGADGRYSTAVRVVTGFDLRASTTTGGTRRVSGTTRLSVQPQVYDLAPAGQPVAVSGLEQTVTGAVYQQLGGRRVKLEHLQGTTWSTVAETRFDAAGRFTLRYVPSVAGTLRYRVVVPSGGGLVMKVVPFSVRSYASPAALVAAGVPCVGALTPPAGGCDNPDLGSLVLPTQDPAALRLDTGGSYNPACWTSDVLKAVVASCRFGSARPDALKVALVGDSHAAGYLAALRPKLEWRGWRLDTYLSVGCRWMDVPPEDPCAPRAQHVHEALIAGDYDLVVISGLRQPAGSSAEQAVEVSRRYSRAWSEIVDGGAAVVAIADFGYFTDTAVACTTSTPWPDVVARCTTPRSDAMRGIDPLVAAVQSTPGSALVTLDDKLCTAVDCPLVIGRTLVYRDRHHLTGTYSASLAGVLSSRIAAAYARVQP